MKGQMSKKLTRRKMLKLLGTGAAGSPLTSLAPAAEARENVPAIKETVPEGAQGTQVGVYYVLPPYGVPTIKVLQLDL